MACEAKILETRAWNTRIRGDVYIHAAKTTKSILKALKLPEDTIRLFELGLNLDRDEWLEELPRGALLCVGELTESMTSEEAMIRFDWQEDMGDFGPGRYAHLYEHIYKLEAPIPMKGQQGFFFGEVPINPPQK